MSATTKLNFDDFQKILETENEVRYELDEGELLVTPSPTLRHNDLCFRIRAALLAFAQAHKLGYVTGETDFRLGPDTVRRPDVAFIAAHQLQHIDIDRSPVEGAPALAVEIISPSNLAQDTFKKVHQYLAAGSQAGWVVYPALKTIEIHRGSGTHEITGGFLQDDRLFPGLKLSLAGIFNSNLLP